LNEEIANNMRWHGEGRNNDGVLRHPADALAWKDFDIKHPEFATEIRNIRLGLASDGFIPFAINNNSYSIWPVILVLYNLPPWLCMKSDFLIVSMLIPGPRDPSNDINVYLTPLIDELKDLWEVGTTTYDS
jgi:Transposase family tnp2